MVSLVRRCRPTGRYRLRAAASSGWCDWRRVGRHGGGAPSGRRGARGVSVHEPGRCRSRRVRLGCLLRPDARSAVRGAAPAPVMGMPGCRLLSSTHEDPGWT